MDTLNNCHKRVCCIKVSGSVRSHMDVLDIMSAKSKDMTDLAVGMRPTVSTDSGRIHGRLQLKDVEEARRLITFICRSRIT